MEGDWEEEGLCRNVDGRKRCLFRDSVEGIFRLFRRGGQASPDPGKGVIENSCNTFFEGDDTVIGDADVFRADFSTAFGDIAVTDAENFFEVLIKGQIHFEMFSLLFLFGQRT